MDPLDAPEPIALLNRELTPGLLRGNPTLVALEPTVLDEDDIPWDEVLEDVFFTMEPAPQRAVAIEEPIDPEPEIEFRTRSRLPAALFVCGGIVLAAAAALVVGLSALPVGTESATSEAEWVAPAPIPPAAIPEAIEVGESTRPRRWVRRAGPRRAPALPDRIQAPLSVSQLPALRVDSLPPAR